MMHDPTRALSDIIGDLLRQLTSLFRSEGQLARTEVSEKLQNLGGALALVATGLVVLLPGTIILLEAAVAGLIQAGFGPAIAALSVGAVVLLVGIVLFVIGVNRLKTMSLVPDKTLRQLQRNFAIVKDVTHEHDVQRAA
jgi:putative superfamily III holin-X